MRGDCRLCGTAGLNRQDQREGCPLADAVAVRSQFAAELAGQQGAVVQAETVAVLPGREPVAEDPRQIVRRDACAVVDNLDFDAIAIRPPDANGHCPGRVFTRPQRLLGILDKVHQDLQDVSSVGCDLRGLLIIGDQLDAVAIEEWRGDPQRVALFTSLRAHPDIMMVL